MPKDEELYAALVDGDLRGALGETVELLAGGEVVALEDTWIAALSAIGERMPTGLWSVVAEELSGMLLSGDDAISVKDAFRTSVSLALLFRRAAAAGKRRRERVGIGELRERVAADFPEGAALSPAGARQFARLMEGMTETETTFAHRVLAGICRLWTERQRERARVALEYLTRRRMLALPVLSEWAVSRDEGDRGDIAWFLWGAVRVRFGTRSELVALWELYKWNWRRGVKTDRIGLLWAAGELGAKSGEGAAAEGGAGAGGVSEWAWNAQELETLKKAEDHSADIWKQLAPAVSAAGSGGAGGDASGSDGGSEGRRGGGGRCGGGRRGGGRMGPASAAVNDAVVARMNLWMTYMPRVGSVGNAALPAPTPAVMAGPLVPKALKIKASLHGSGQAQARAAGSGSAAVATVAKRGVYERDHEDAPGRPYPGDRRERFGQARPDSQEVLSAKAYRQPMDQSYPF